MRLTPADILEQAMNHPPQTEAQREDLRSAMGAALVLGRMADEGLIGGTQAEDDCPREPGSKHGRPDGLSAGARARWGI